MKLKTVLLILIAGFFIIGFWALKKAGEKYPWLEMYAADQLKPKPRVEGSRHILFTFVDHFEPHDLAAMQRWYDDYPKMAAKHQDADGKYPQHTSFWYNGNLSDQDVSTILRQLAELTYRGFGEVEFHLHHWNDNEATLTEKIRHAIKLSQETGAFITAEAKPQTAYGFVHGRWSLDNSRGAGDCGVNSEILVLRKTGCYADFTHPSWGAMHPKTVNRFYYVTDDPAKPKSYDRGPEMEVGKPGVGDLLLMEGVSVVRWNGFRPVYDHGDITHEDLPTPGRIQKWVEANIHVKGRPEWVFVRIFTHGVVPEDHEAVLGKWADEMHSYLEKNYNDGKKYVLHYVTSREAYNIAKAAEAGKKGNPNDYRNYLIAPYVQKFFIANVPFETISFDKESAVIRFLAASGTPVTAHLRGAEVKISGGAVEPKIESAKDESVIHFKTSGEGLVGFTFKPFKGSADETENAMKALSLREPIR